MIDKKEGPGSQPEPPKVRELDNLNSPTKADAASSNSGNGTENIPCDWLNPDLLRRITIRFHPAVSEDGFPEFEDADMFTAEESSDDPEVIRGLLRTGEKCILGAPAKGKKSWALIDLFVAVSNGLIWMSWQCEKDNVLYVNLELRAKGFRKRLKEVKEARGITSTSGSSVWNVRGKNKDIKDLVTGILQRCSYGQYSLIIIDPIYKALGNRDENRASDVAELLSHIERLTEELGAAVVLAHHFPKGDSAQKQNRDKTSGSGVFMRDPDVAINLTPQKPRAQERQDPEPDYNRFTVDVTVREYPDIKPFVIEYHHPLFRLDEHGDPKAVRAKSGPKTELDPRKLVELLPASGLRHADWRQKASEAYGISTATFNRRLNDIKRLGLVSLNEQNCWIPRPVKRLVPG
jgi:hypothetical protein